MIKKSTRKPGLVAAHCRVILARVELKKALAEYNAIKFSPPESTAEVSGSTTPSLTVQGGNTELCLFPQPRFNREPFTCVTGDLPLYAGAGLREGYESQYPIDAPCCIASGSVASALADSGRSSCFGWAVACVGFR
jgi:hypothetical protein